MDLGHLQRSASFHFLASRVQKTGWLLLAILYNGGGATAPMGGRGWRFTHIDKDKWLDKRMARAEINREFLHLSNSRNVIFICLCLTLMKTTAMTDPLSIGYT